MAKNKEKIKNKKIDEGSLEENKNPSGMTKQFYWFIGIMLFFVILFLAMTTVLQNLKTFDYRGMSFTKVKYGDTYFYQYDYYFKNERGGVTKYYLNLQVDPRQNNVSVDGNIDFRKGEFIYLSINETGLKECKYGEAAVGALAGFLAGNDIKAIAAVPNDAEAEQRGVKYASCEASPLPGRIVILLEQGNETKITKENNCHRIQISNCELFPAVEKFMVQALIDSQDSGSSNQTNSLV